MIVYEYDLDMVPGLTQGRTVVSLSQYDDNFFINFHLYTRNGSFVIESGTTARIRGTKPDGNGFSATATVDASDMTVLVEGDKQMTAAAGTSQYELTLMKGTKELNTANFDVYIERAALDIDTPSSETKLRELYDLPVDEILQAATTAVDAKDDAEDARDAAIAAKDEAVSVTDGLMEIVRGSFIYETESGSMASFPDGGDGLPVKSVSVNVDPVQDLHGYSKPWPGGAGKNLFDKYAVTDGYYIESDGRIVGTPGWCVSDYMLVTEGGYIASGYATTGSGVNLAVYNTNKEYIRSVGMTTPGTTAVTISTGEAYVRMSVRRDAGEHNTTQFEKGSTATSYEPYSNICPITGHTSAKITRVGKNLLNDSLKDIGTFSGVTVSQNSNGEFVLNGTATANNFVRVGTVTLPAGSYSFSGMTSTGSSSTYFLNLTPRYDGISNENLYSGEYSGTSTEECTYTVRIYFRSGAAFNNMIFKPMIRSASDTDPTFEPYQGHVYNVTFPGAAGTVYGATLDPVHGTLWVNKAYFKPTSYVNNSINEFSVSVSAVAPSAIAGNLTFISNMMTAGYRNQNNVQSKKIVCYRGGSSDHKEIAIAGDITLYPTNDALIAALADAEFVYELETPVRYSAMIDEDEITTLLGINHVWANTGEVSVEYAADPKLYINKVIANALNA